MDTTEHLLRDFSQQAMSAIPLLQSMELSFSEFNDHCLRVDMPLAPNVNDKNTGFGGSIAALATTAGWAVISLILRRLPRHYHVLVAESHIRYLSPATANCYALASVTDSAKSAFINVLQEHHSGRITIQSVVEQDGKQVAVFTGTYKVQLAGSPCQW